MRPSIYQEYITKYFTRLLELRHTAAHINSTLKKSVKEFTGIDTAGFVSLSALAISDWTGPTDNGWTINYHTGISKITYRNDYTNEIERMVSSQCCYSFAQSFEALERFMKDCVYSKSQNDSDYLLKVSSSIKGQVN